MTIRSRSILAAEWKAAISGSNDWSLETDAGKDTQYGEPPERAALESTEGRGFDVVLFGLTPAMAPVLEELAEASEGRVTLMKVNVDENHGLATRYAIQSIPTVLFFKEGAVVDRVLGAAPKAVLQDIVNARA
jgi:thiol-disulfide isomerase/thioredoxin